MELRLWVLLRNVNLGCLAHPPAAGGRMPVASATPSSFRVCFRTVFVLTSCCFPPGLLTVSLAVGFGEFLFLPLSPGHTNGWESTIIRNVSILDIKNLTVPPSGVLK